MDFAIPCTLFYGASELIYQQNGSKLHVAVHVYVHFRFLFQGTFLELSHQNHFMAKDFFMCYKILIGEKVVY